MKRFLFSGLVLCLAACSQADEPEIHIGYIEAEWRYIAAPQAGWITDSQIEPGMDIAIGDLLFNLDVTAQKAAVSEADARIRQASANAQNASTGARVEEIRQLQARVDETKAMLDEAAAELKRTQLLFDQGYAAQAALDRDMANLKTAQASVKAAEQAVAVARLAARPAERDAADAAIASAEAGRESALYQLSQRAVTSDMAGRVEEVFLRKGEYVTPGMPVLAVLPEDGLKVRFFVPQADLPQLSVGQSVSVHADGLATAITGKISYISSQAEFTPPVIYSRDARQKLVFVVEAHVPTQAGLHAGLPVEVRW